MKQYIIFILILLLSSSAEAVDFQVSVYPDSNQIEVTTTTIGDSITVTINNLSSDSVQNFYLTINTPDSIFIIENIVDGNINPVSSFEISNGTVYPNQVSTSWLVGTFLTTVSLKYSTPTFESSLITFSGKQPFAFFGIVERLSSGCCVGMRGNIDSDINESIDISDLVYFVSYAFGVPSGLAPSCFEEADVDASGTLDISDLVHLVNYMFSTDGTVPPLDCPQ